MSNYRAVAIPTRLVNKVRTTMKAPMYGHPAHLETATGYGPCRHCLRTFRIGEESRILFTYNSFLNVETIPLPGPVFVHAEGCERYAEEAGYPQELLAHGAVLNAYGKGQTLVARTVVEKAGHEEAVQRLLDTPGVDYIQVHDLEAGCYDFRIEPVR